MDVLQLIKKQHDMIRALGKGLGGVATVTDRRKLYTRLAGVVAVQMKIEEEYLLPEVTAVDASARRVAEANLSRHHDLRNQMKVLEKAVNKRPQPAKDEVESQFNVLWSNLKFHLTLVEDELLPRIRQRIPTQDREDLGEALQDVLAEELKDLGIAEEISSIPAVAM